MATSWLWPSWCCRPFAAERGAAGGSADQKALGAGVGRRPDQVADALKAEHRVIDVKRHHVLAEVAVRGAGGDERRHRPRLVDSLFEHLAVFGLSVVHQLTGVDRLVQLAFAGINAALPEQRFHAERARLVGNDGHDAFADALLSFSKPLRIRPNAIVVAISTCRRASSSCEFRRAAESPAARRSAIARR